MAPGIPQLLSFPQDGGHWRLDCVGPVLTGMLSRTPVARVQLSTERDSSPREIRFADISVMLYSLLVPGSDWVNGIRRSLRASDSRVTEVDIDVHPLMIRFTTAWGRIGGAYVIPRVSLQIDRAFKDANFVIISRFPRDNIGDIVIPCAELFRAYFARFGWVAYYILTGCFFGPGRDRIFDNKRSLWQDEDAFVVLGGHIPDKAATDVARLAFDYFASRVADRLIADVIAASYGTGTYMIGMPPPFQGRSTWRIRGRSIGTAAWPRFLVDQLLWCSAKRPFERVHSYRDNPGGNPAPLSAPQSAFGRVIKKQRPANSIVTISSTFDPTIDEIPLDMSDPEAPPISAPLPHTRYRNLDARRRSGSRLVKMTAPGRIHSAGVGVWGSGLSPVTIEPAGDPGGIHAGTLRFFDLTIEAMTDPALTLELGAAILVTSVTVHLEWDPTRRPIKWAYIVREGQQIPRRVIIATIVIDGAPFVLFEIERRPTESSQATLGVAGSPSQIEIQALFYAIARGAGMYDEELLSDLRLAHLPRLSFRHNPKNTPADYALRILKRLVAVASDDLGNMIDGSRSSDATAG